MNSSNEKKIVKNTGNSLFCIIRENKKGSNSVVIVNLAFNYPKNN